MAQLEQKFYLKDYANEETSGPFDYDEMKNWVVSEGYKTTFDILKLEDESFVEYSKVFTTNRDYVIARQKYLEEVKNGQK